jgi:hypothetical protein
MRRSISCQPRSSGSNLSGRCSAKNSPIGRKASGVSNNSTSCNAVADAISPRLLNQQPLAVAVGVILDARGVGGVVEQHQRISRAVEDDFLDGDVVDGKL